MRHREWHRTGRVGWLRAAVLGANDGIVSTASLVVGVAAAHAERGELLAGTVDSWLIARLSHGKAHVTDRTNASRTMLYNLEADAWDRDLTSVFRVPDRMLPRIVPSSGVCGEADPVHFGFALPIAGIAGDQQAALFGQGCVKPGMAKNTYGTGAFLLLYTGEQPPPAPDGLLATVACDARGQRGFALEGSVFMAGAVIQWLRDGLGLLESSSESARLAATVPDTGGVHLVPAFVGLGSPYWEADARGTITGLTRGTTRAHLVRAGLEAIAMSSAELLEVMLAGTGLALPGLRVDGGATANDWLMQFQADVLGVPVERPANLETTAFGAATLATWARRSRASRSSSSLAASACSISPWLAKAMPWPGSPSACGRASTHSWGAGP